MTIEAETPKIVSQAREAARELVSRKERARSLHKRTIGLLAECPTGFRRFGSVMEKLGLMKPTPVLEMTFGESEDRVEVVISPGSGAYIGGYEPNLEKAAVLITVGRHFSLALPPNRVHFGGSFPLPESSELDLYEELLEAFIEK